ncbi:hypothetical protein DY000_02056782 [Brassica cretica]|uniref:Pentacotripeptide-repeat region of PRORP domain-containing protein n=1 Tax=Brassica cretica TaxID=69181 RepID=A0ABQ7AKG8_BRACR|nr:hypothetical protein DY000_02056782 [Brassica cretica]
MLRLKFRNCRLTSTPSRNYIHSNAVRSNLHSTNLKLGDLSKSGRIEEARQLFDKMSDKDEYTWNTMIVAYSSSGRLSDAKHLFHRNPVKNTISWNALISGHCKNGNKDEALSLFWEMQFQERSFNEYTLGSVLKMCALLGLLLRDASLKLSISLGRCQVRGTTLHGLQCLLATLETGLLTRRLSVSGI